MAGIKVSLQDQIAEVKREIGMRKRVYIRLVTQKKMTPDEAETFTRRMVAVLDTLELLARVQMEGVSGQA